ncbi:MAG: DUF4396 domain-containing protein [Bacteroidetes bacterium]|nr:DUF4396 domain-containing protein [Bacteroidota bacterium]
MKHTYSVSGMTCSGCAATVEKKLASVANVEQVNIDLGNGTAEVTMSHHVPLAQLQQSLVHNPAYQISEWNPRSTPPENKMTSANPFWNDTQVWQRAALNTLNCLVGCSIGDFAMVIFLQKFYPHTSMGMQMVLATISGLITSVMLETILLKTRENFSWKFALQTAFAMSFISMIAMELVMNTTDFMMTGGKAAFGNPMYWIALVVAMVAGFLAPLPYNYYKLKKYNKACH